MFKNVIFTPHFAFSKKAAGLNQVLKNVMLNLFQHLFQYLYISIPNQVQDLVQGDNIVFPNKC